MLLLAAMLVLAGCASPNHRAPVEERGPSGSRAATPVATTAPAEPTRPPPGIENLGKPGYYQVKAGDTLIKVGLESGQGWRDLQRWNGIDNPNLIEVGQVLRVVPPGVDPSAPAPRPVTTAKVEARPLDTRPASAPASSTPAAPAPVAASAPPVAPPPAPAAAAPAARDADDDINWMWPANGAVVGPFDDPRVKGLVIGGKAGDPVMAAADGRVIYAGSGIRGYGNLVIVKHNTNYLTAYGHNQTLLVKEDQVVRRGQKIAEMGSSDAERVQLHFEIRRQGKPLDPAKLLPQR